MPYLSYGSNNTCKLEPSLEYSSPTTAWEHSLIPKFPPTLPYKNPSQHYTQKTHDSTSPHSPSSSSSSSSSPLSSLNPPQPQEQEPQQQHEQEEEKEQEPKYNINDKVYAPDKKGILYFGMVKKRMIVPSLSSSSHSKTRGGYKYLIHFYGWGDRHDHWSLEQQVLPNTRINRKRAEQMLHDASMTKINANEKQQDVVPKEKNKTQSMEKRGDSCNHKKKTKKNTDCHEPIMTQKKIKISDDFMTHSHTLSCTSSTHSDTDIHANTPTLPRKSPRLTLNPTVHSSIFSVTNQSDSSSPHSDIPRTTTDTSETTTKPSPSSDSPSAVATATITHHGTWTTELEETTPKDPSVPTRQDLILERAKEVAESTMDRLIRRIAESTVEQLSHQRMLYPSNSPPNNNPIDPTNKDPNTEGFVLPTQLQVQLQAILQAQVQLQTQVTVLQAQLEESSRQHDLTKIQLLQQQQAFMSWMEDKFQLERRQSLQERKSNHSFLTEDTGSLTSSTSSEPMSSSSSSSSSCRFCFSSSLSSPSSPMAPSSSFPSSLPSSSSSSCGMTSTTSYANYTIVDASGREFKLFPSSPSCSSSSTSSSTTSSTSQLSSPCFTTSTTSYANYTIVDASGREFKLFPSSPSCSSTASSSSFPLSSSCVTTSTTSSTNYKIVDGSGRVVCNSQFKL